VLTRLPFFTHTGNGASTGKITAAHENLIPVGTRALILSKRYYGVLTKSLEAHDIERYYSVLYFLYYNNRCSQQHICNNLAIDKTAMVKVMDYLVKAGYVKRSVNPGDRREHFVVLTAPGRKKTEEIVKSFKAIDKDIFTGISKGQKEQFISIMAALTSRLCGMPSHDLFFNYTNHNKKTKTKVLK
jgi:DNA-binding MarR family transcriptional regulator